MCYQLIIAVCQVKHNLEITGGPRQKLGAFGHQANGRFQMSFPIGGQVLLTYTQTCLKTLPI